MPGPHCEGRFVPATEQAVRQALLDKHGPDEAWKHRPGATAASEAAAAGGGGVKACPTRLFPCHLTWTCCISNGHTSHLTVTLVIMLSLFFVLLTVDIRPSRRGSAPAASRARTPRYVTAVPFHT